MVANAITYCTALRVSGWFVLWRDGDDLSSSFGGMALLWRVNLPRDLPLVTSPRDLVTSPS